MRPELASPEHVAAHGPVEGMEAEGLVGRLQEVPRVQVHLLLPVSQAARGCHVLSPHLGEGVLEVARRGEDSDGYLEREGRRGAVVVSGSDREELGAWRGFGGANNIPRSHRRHVATV